MSVISLRAKILQKLGEMQTLKATYDWETSNSGGNYPYATLTLRYGTGQFRSTADNLRRRGFRIRVYQEKSKAGQAPEDSETIVSNIIDELEIAFDMDTTLSGTCKYVTPVGFDASYIDRDLDVRVLEVHLDAYELVLSQ